MWPYGRGRIPHLAQNFGAYNRGGYPHTQNQQNTVYTTYAPYLPNPPYSFQEPIGYMTYAPYPQYTQQEIGYTTYSPYPVYSQQEIGVRLSEDPMASDMVFQNQQDDNWFFENRNRCALSTFLNEYYNEYFVLKYFYIRKWNVIG